MIALVSLLACNPPPSAADLAGTEGGRVDVFFNDPGTRDDNLWDPDVVDVMVDLIDQTQATLDFAVMGFTNDDVVDAILRAYERGVAVRMVGDAGHINNSGYRAMYERHIPMTVGNQAHIMHDKFLVADGRFVFCGTANWSNSDLTRNVNNFVVMDSPYVAADFTAEFEQMFAGKFGAGKVALDNGVLYELGDTTVEVWFSPNEDALGRLVEAVESAQESVRFTIFAFTKDRVGGALLEKQQELLARSEAEGLDTSGDPDSYYTVAGVIDQSQLHSNGQYHEVYRLLSHGVPVRLDSDDNSELPGDYQAGGGRLHSKTMLIDLHGEDPTIVTGSFNWSASATQSNDEFLLILKGPRVAEMYDEYFRYLWDSARDIGGSSVDEVGGAGSVVINEVMWYGVNSGDPDGFDEFIELRNLTDEDIDLSMWQISNEQDVVVGLPPGSVLPAGGLFTILDHTLEAYKDGEPQDETSAFTNGDLVVNTFNDNRQSRLYLKDGNLELYLRDPYGAEMDAAGDGGAAFAGGPDGSVVRSMERDATPGDGTSPESWHACSLDRGGANVNEAYKDEVIATPGEENSP